MRRLISAVALASAAGLATTGCSSDTPGTADGGTGTGDGRETAAEVSAEVLAWSEEFCGHVAAGGDGLTVPEEGTEDGPQQAQEDIVLFLDDLAGRLAALEEGITETGPPPVPEGQALFDAALSGLGEARTALASAASSLEEAGVNDDPEALATAVSRAEEDMAAVDGYEGPVREFRADEQLNTAFDALENCRDL
ncbi:hypothetical protein [Streptomyces sp. YIM 98790]|uniref:hypothetical protein n=1 Tax=Streptomyces sp. YIM 98790 TaxID=2689077 RepID=UPI00140775C8|nr:hypothetical protein [Streptomyces sp. YIM 98790]